MLVQHDLRELGRIRTAQDEIQDGMLGDEDAPRLGGLVSHTGTVALPGETLKVTVQGEQASRAESKLAIVADHAETGTTIESRDEFCDVHLAGLVHNHEIEQAELERKYGAEVLDLGGPERHRGQGVSYLGRSEDGLKARRLAEEEDLLEAL